MMKSIGNTLVGLALLIIALGATTAVSAVTAKLNRSNVALGDTLQLTITSDADEELNEIDLQPLLSDFEILQRSSSSNTSIVNGRISHTNQLIIALTPRRQGDLAIPSLDLDGQSTARLPLTVGATPEVPAGEETVLFEAEVDQDTVYVQAQVIFTLRIQQAINLDGHSISELALANAFVKPLEQTTFERTVNGRPWRVHELRYAIFPEKSGTLEIPAQVFSARVAQGRRSLFDRGGSGKRVRLTTGAIPITVLPRPESYDAPTWLPSRQITIQEQWSTPPEQLRVGDSATRSIQILGEGLQGAQLPPILFPAVDGLKYYPDQPEISEREIATGLLGVRKDSAALVPTQAGTFMIPEIRIPWWDTQTRQMRYAVVPQREITVAAADTGSSAAPAIPLSPQIQTTTPTLSLAPSPAQKDSIKWKIISAVIAAGWLTTLLVFWRRRRPVSHAPLPIAEDVSEKQAFRELLSACSKGNSAAARAAFIAWSAALTGEAAAYSLDEAASRFGDDRLKRELEILDGSLYSTTHNAWVGTSLAEHAQTVRAHYRKSRRQSSDELKLYP